MSYRSAWLLCVSLCLSAGASADPVALKHMEGDVHAFLTISDDAGKLIGYADEVNVRAGRSWRSRLTIHFKDGSLADETALYTQGASLHLLTDHLVEKGPSFPRPTDLTIDTAKQQVVYHQEKDGKDELKTDAMELPADLANGILPMLLQNLSREQGEIKVGYVVMTPKPRLVRFAIHPDGQESYRAGTGRSANHFRIHIDIGGIQGMVAPVIGKEPADMEAWVSAGEAPTFLRLHAFLYDGGPLWTLQLASPEWQDERLTRSSGAGAQ